MTSILPDTGPIPVQRTSCAPLLDLLRALLRQYGEVTFRAAPSGYVASHERAIGIPDDLDDRALLSGLVIALHDLAVADMEPQLVESAGRFALDAARDTLAALGEVTR